MRRRGLALPQCWGTDTLRRPASCHGRGWRQSCPPAVPGKDTLGKSLFSFLYPCCMGVASARVPARTHKHPFSPSQPHCFPPVAVWVLLGDCWRQGARARGKATAICVGLVVREGFILPERRPLPPASPSALSPSASGFLTLLCAFSAWVLFFPGALFSFDFSGKT